MSFINDLLAFTASTSFQPSYTVTQRFLQWPDLIMVDKTGQTHNILSNETVTRVFKRLADRLQGVVSDTSVITITLEYAAHFLEQYLRVIETDGTNQIFHVVSTVGGARLDCPGGIFLA